MDERKAPSNVYGRVARIELLAVHNDVVSDKRARNENSNKKKKVNKNRTHVSQ